jgi:hypothetical protein
MLPFPFKMSLKIPKGYSESAKSKKDKQHNGQKKKDKRTNNDLQSVTQKTKDRVTATLVNIGVNSCAPHGKQWIQINTFLFL